MASPKKKNRNQDATLRNIDALKRRVAMLERKMRILIRALRDHQVSTLELKDVQPFENLMKKIHEGES